MIKDFTSNQLFQIPEFINRWTEIGLSTEQISDDNCLEITREILTSLLKYKETTPIILMDSPKSCWEAVEKLNKKCDKKTLTDQVGMLTYAKMSETLEADLVWKLTENFLGKPIEIGCIKLRERFDFK